MPEVRISFCGGWIVLALTLVVSNCRGLWNKMDKVRGPAGAGYPLAKSSLPRGLNRKTWEKSELRPTNVSARRSGARVLPRSCYETRTQLNSDILAPHHVAEQGRDPK
jgi:hypothetical protein